MSDIDSKSAIDRIGKRLDEIEAKCGPNAPPEQVLNELFPNPHDRQTFEQRMTLLKNHLMKKHGHKLNPKPATN